MSELSLEIVEGPGAGRQVPLGEPLVVGRAQDVQVVLDDPQVSRRHARISPRGEQAIVEDLGSSNGTFVNGSELHAPAAVGGGDEVLVGVTVLEVRSMAQISERPSAVRPVPQAIAAQPAAAPQQPPAEWAGEQPAAAAAGPAPPAHGHPAPPLPGQAPPAFSAAPLSQPGAPQGPGKELDRLFDARTKKRAQAAPFAIFALVVLVLLIYFATR